MNGVGDDAGAVIREIQRFDSGHVQELFMVLEKETFISNGSRER